MAFFQCNFFSPTLCFNTDINVFIPTPNSDELQNGKKSDYFYDGAHFQVLYLLHGAYGDYTDWMRLTNIEKYAQNHKLAVVMPSASNSFYQDMFRGSAYLTYLTKELPEFVRALFPISLKRENTFTAGLSMGGYGALRLAFEKPENYSACASLSGAIDICDIMRSTKDGKMDGPFRWADIFEHPEQVEGSDADLFALIAKRKAEHYPLPKIFQSCGTEDFIYQSNVGAHKKLQAIGVEHTYEEHPGIHDWDYWDTHIQRVLEWLPLANDAVKE
ncbi:alpha/beta hydrolase [Acetanaerobacterium elongatum]|uniref:S-formylglutathione hydrolase FrmB n=1 Tax=Acetanaerobacterium elongatum TaxID=258515 RepID=A0A1G9USI3_9FIRM|nr:alpha/beta hydrolase family protein [Acetanaerobacterium elongatum]SDM62844.1 S-formylglutathione hydrolase FrmB [Acetanaerobacterium elongatum]